MSKESESREIFHAIQKAKMLRERAPIMLDALRLIRFAVTHDHDSAAGRAEIVLKLCKAALKGMEDI